MATVAAPAIAPLHPLAAEFTAESRSVERRVGLVCAISGILVILVMGVFGLVMRLAQANVIHLSPGWFYRLLTLHGMGMITGTLLAGMSALWYVLHEHVPLRVGHMVWSYGLIVAGALLVVVATLAGGFGAAWTYLPPLPFFPAGQWTVWSEAVFFVGTMLVGTGFFVYSVDVLTQTSATYGGFTGALGWKFLVGRTTQAPPAPVIAATVVSFDALLALSAGAAITLGLLGHTYDGHVGLDPLVAKNLIYFFGHTAANLLMYLAAGMVYVVLPRYAGRAYEVTKVFVVGWAAALVLILSVYSHHLYMDFVQPRWAEVISEISSYSSALPVAVITIFSMTMLVWGSAYRWTLASSLLYIGLAGWAIGGTGAVIDSIIPFNFRFHNTVWVVAHFHTYLMLTVVVWLFAFVAHIVERDAGGTSPPAARSTMLVLLLVGGFGLTGTWFVGGVLGIPRRYALQPPGTTAYSLVGSIFGVLFAVGVLAYIVQLVPLARRAWERRHDGSVPLPERPAVAAAPYSFRDVPLAGPAQLAVGAAACVVGLSAFFPQVVHASEASVRYHHLDHAGHFAFGVAVGAVLGSLPWLSRLLGGRSGWGLAALLLAPSVMMLVMVPRLYEPLERHPAEHALYHVGMAALGIVTGIGCTRLGRVGGRLGIVLAIGMALMFAAAMKGA